MQELIVTVGLPASGKTTAVMEFIQKNPEYVNVNRDDIRLMLQGRARYAKFSKWREDTVSDIAKAAARSSLLAGKSVIISDTNLDPKRNVKWQELSIDHRVKYREWLFTDVPFGVCLERDAKREFPVGQKVIERMFNSYQDIWWPAPKEIQNAPNAYIFDVDGTLAQMDGRSPFAWDKVDTDLPKHDVIRMVNILAEQGYFIIIMSGRDGVCEKLTREWLLKHCVNYDAFYIRPAGDNRPDYDIKRELYKNHVEGNYNVMGVFDDRDQVVHLWRSLGLTCFQVNYGNF